MTIKLTEHEQNLASENIRLTTELIKRNIGRNGLTYDETYDAAIEALIRSAKDFKPSLGYKFSTLYFVSGNNMIKRKIRDKNAKKRSGKTVSIHEPIATKDNQFFEICDLLSYHEKYSFFDCEEIQLAFNDCGLNDKEKQCVYLYYFKEMSQNNTAREIGLSQTHVGRLLGKSIEKMRKYILEKG